MALENSSLPNATGPVGKTLLDLGAEDSEPGPESISHRQKRIRPFHMKQTRIL